GGIPASPRLISFRQFPCLASHDLAVNTGQSIGPRTSYWKWCRRFCRLTISRESFAPGLDPLGTNHNYPDPARQSQNYSRREVSLPGHWELARLKMSDASSGVFPEN